ncbi:MAG: VWA domain-containing protein, partial [Deltaproteobacteria bacterium]|nr:VWA domain-containing protein [Deltaproteobacteria bacterium]
MRKSLSVVFVGLSGLALLACGGNGSGDPFSGTGGSGGVVLTCASLQNPPPDCDETCTSDSQCEASFCQNGKCVANCTATEGCGPNATCNTARGRCVPNMGTGGTGGIGNTGGNACQSVTITPTRTIPNVMFLVDESGSMDASFGGGLDRWEAAHQAIVGNPDAVPPVEGIVEQLEAIVRFGLTTYHSQGGFGSGGGLECPIFETEVSIALNNHSAIDAAYPATFQDIGVDTPTGESIDRLVTELQTNPPPAAGPTIIVLATDGEPDTCTTPNPQTGQPEAVAAATNAYTAGFQTFILSVGNEVSDAHLQDMANVGVGLPANGSGGDADFWKATDSDQLATAFDEIVRGSISCDIQMDKRFDDKEKACNDPESDVQLNGVPLSCPTEWRVK